MKKRMFKNFLTDHLFFTMVYFVSNFCIGLFYYISTGSSVETAYPAALCMFFYLIFMLYRWIIYSSFNTRASKLANNINYEITAYTQEEKGLVRIITEIHQSYMEKINSIHFDSENKKHFLSQWIHDMKTPVSVIDLIAQKTLRGEIPMDKALEDIKEENANLLNKLEQVLNLARLEEFTEDYVPEAVDLSASIRKVINNRKNQFIYSRVYPKLEVEEGVQVLTDEKWNEAMLEQIVSNAIKYSDTKEQAKNVYFTIKRNREKILLSIRDEGIGIPEYDLSRVFKPFFTGDNGRNYSGASGIGLYFCSQVARRLGHELDIKSEAGKGTEIIISYLAKM